MTDLSKYKEIKPHRVRRIAWLLVSHTVYRCFPTVYLRSIRNLILRAFGCSIPLKTLVYPSCRIYAPWLLSVGRNSCIGPRTEIYNKAPVTIGDNSVVSQGTFLCTASHDISCLMLPLVTKPINIGDNVWLAADTFIGPGVSVGDGAVLGARAALFKDLAPWSVAGGNPAVVIKSRKVKE